MPKFPSGCQCMKTVVKRETLTTSFRTTLMPLQETNSYACSDSKIDTVGYLTLQERIADQSETGTDQLQIAKHHNSAPFS